MARRTTIITGRDAMGPYAYSVPICHHTYRDGLCAKCLCPETDADVPKAEAAMEARREKRLARTDAAIAAHQDRIERAANRRR